MNKRGWLCLVLWTVAAGTGSVVLARANGQAGWLGGTSALGCNDLDGDGYGIGCAAGQDCNDRDPAIRPGAVEACNLRDDHCDSRVDEAPGCVAPAEVTAGAGA